MPSSKDFFSRSRRRFRTIVGKVQNKKNKLNKIETIKILVSLSLPLAVGIFTIITTIQSREIALAERLQDVSQAEDDQRETIFTNYINDIARFRDKNLPFLNNSDKLVYIRAKTLAALRKLDKERKTMLLFFLRDNSLLSVTNDSFLMGADFSGIQLEGETCSFSYGSMNGFHFEDAVFRSCSFRYMSFRQTSFTRTDFGDSVFIRCDFIESQMTETKFPSAVLTEVIFNHTKLSNSDFRQTTFDAVQFVDSNLTAARFDETSFEIDFRDTLLPNGTFSTVDEIFVQVNICNSSNRWIFNQPRSIEIVNCTLFSTVPNATVEYKVPIALDERSILVDSHQAEFYYQLDRDDSTSPVMIYTFFWSTKTSIFEPHENDCLMTVDRSCRQSFHLPPYVRNVDMFIVLRKAQISISNISFGLRQISRD